ITNFSNTDDGGLNWTGIGSMHFSPISWPVVSKLNGNPVIYEAYDSQTATTNGYSKFGLWRISNVNGPNITAESANLNCYGGMANYWVNFGNYTIFNAEPSNADHIIMADIQSSEMMVSWDGGKNWSPDDELTKLVTGNGQFKFYDQSVDAHCLVTC